MNHEGVVLAGAVQHCKIWHRIRDFYFPLSVQEWRPRTVVTEEAEAHL